MKARFRYIQLPFAVFADKYPHIAVRLLPPSEWHDTEYFVRFVPDREDNPIETFVEVGYLTDKWMIK